MRHGVILSAKKIKKEMSSAATAPTTSATNPRQLQQYSGQWNVQVVRGKVTTRCLWNACKALSIGLLLMIIGTTMAIVGYYADQLSIRSEIRGNSTIKVKNESRGFHLNNLSYAGPIVMGVGGFIVVAACVMTFEARDSAAKVVPARFKPNTNSSVQVSSTKSTPHCTRTFQRLDSKKNTGCQTPGSKGPYSYKLGSLGGSGLSPINDPAGRRALTAAFVQFSRTLIEHASFENSQTCSRKLSDANLKKSPSAPNLGTDERHPASSPNRRKQDESRRLSRISPKPGHKCNRSPIGLNGTLLSPRLLQRQALSMDTQFYDGCYTPPRLSREPSDKSGGSRDSLELGASAGVSGSQASMALDLHDCQVTLQVKDESQSKRSDTARRHQLLRQKPVEDEKEMTRCSCIPKMLCTHTVDDSAIKTVTRSHHRNPRYQSLRLIQKDHTMPDYATRQLSDFRHRSFSHSRSYTEDRDRKLAHFHDLERKIYCIEDHQNRRFPSCERIKKSPDDKTDRRHSGQNRSSPDKSPQGNCRIHQHNESVECIVHGNPDPILNHVLVRKNAKRRKSTQKMEGSISIEENRSFGRSFSRSPTERGRLSRSPTLRSPSASPTRTSGTKSASTSPKNSCQVHSSSRKSSRSPSPVPATTEEEVQIESPNSILPCSDSNKSNDDVITSQPRKPEQPP